MGEGVPQQVHLRLSPLSGPGGHSPAGWAAPSIDGLTHPQPRREVILSQERARWWFPAAVPFPSERSELSRGETCPVTESERHPGVQARRGNPSFFSVSQQSSKYRVGVLVTSNGCPVRPPPFCFMYSVCFSQLHPPLLFMLPLPLFVQGLLVFPFRTAGRGACHISDGGRRVTPLDRG